jgi:putative restriction endonuclease
VVSVDPDLAMRQAAITRALELKERYDDLVPRAAILEGFEFRGQRISFGSLQRGIHRPRQMRGPGALTIITAPPVPGKERPYADVFEDDGPVIYHYRAGAPDQPDNRALRAAAGYQSPLIYFLGVAPSQYYVIAPVFIAKDLPAERHVILEVGIPLVDTQPSGPVTTPDTRAYALRQVKTRLHQRRFQFDVLRAYAHQCTICALRQRELVQAAHIVADPSPQGIAAVVNGLALCAIHHLAYDRNLLGIDPEGVVHIAKRLRDTQDGPMLREGLQGFHGAVILKPRRAVDHPDPERLGLRFAAFEQAA